MSSRLYAVSIALSGIALVACSSGGSASLRSNEHLRRANYYQAYHVLAEDGKADESRLRVVRIAYLLQKGQEEVFNDRELDAIETLSEVLDLDPGNQTAQSWISKARHKLANKAVAQGDNQRGGGDLENALRSYHEALGHVNGHAAALEGVEKVAKTVKKMQARAEDHYVQGVSALGEQLYGMTWYHMVNAVAMDPSHSKAKKSRDEAGQRLIRDRYERATELQEAGYFGAALKEFLSVKEQAPGYDGLDDRIAHMRREVEAERLVRDAEMAAFKRHYVDASQLLEQAYETTISQQAEIVDLQILVRERDLDDRYKQARILELENRLEEALAAYREIDEMWDGGFKDVKAVISSIESTLEVAERAYELGVEAEDRGDLTQAIDAFEEALLVYPGFRDLEGRIAELRKARDRK